MRIEKLVLKYILSWTYSLNVLSTSITNKIRKLFHIYRIDLIALRRVVLNNFFNFFEVCLRLLFILNFKNEFWVVRFINDFGVTSVKILIFWNASNASDKSCFDTISIKTLETLTGICKFYSAWVDFDLYLANVSVIYRITRR